jgi:CDP-glycerol glycerophosphotransferase (TagB/SpsB family)
MMGFDALINDYSTTGVDYSILRRPQFFVMPDFIEFNKHDAFIENYLDAINQSPVADFNSLLVRLASFDSPQPIGFSKYLDSEIQNSCQRNAEFIRSLSVNI